MYVRRTIRHRSSKSDGRSDELVAVRSTRMHNPFVSEAVRCERNEISPLISNDRRCYFCLSFGARRASRQGG